MRGFNFLIHYNKVEVYALIFGHILFNSTLGRKNGLIATHPLVVVLKYLFFSYNISYNETVNSR